MVEIRQDMYHQREEANQIASKLKVEIERTIGAVDNPLGVDTILSDAIDALSKIIELTRMPPS